MKASLKEIATFYENENMVEPRLPIETGADGVSRWVVYAYDFEDGWVITEEEEFASGYYASGVCNLISGLFPKTLDLNPRDPRLALDINTLKQRTISQISSEDIQRFYSVMAHEVFHAIQYSYDLKHSSLLACKDGYGNGLQPIMEGGATAAATLATLKKYPDHLSKGDADDSKFGVFPYGTMDFMSVGSAAEERARGRDGSLAYRTSSFWRFLAERFGGLNVFNRLLSKPFAVSGISPTREERYRWLAENVKDITGKEIYLILPEFFAEFGSYGSSRYIRLGEVEVLAGLNNPKGFRNPCRQIVLNAENRGAEELKLSASTNGLSALGANCISLSWEGIAPPFKIEIEAAHPDVRVLRQLHFGISSLESDGTADNCWDWITNADPKIGTRRDLDCAFGKVFDKHNDLKWGFVKTDPRRLWEVGFPSTPGAFFTREGGNLGPSGTATLVFSNVAVEPGKTTSVPPTDAANDEVVLRFSIRNLRSADSRRFEPPGMLETNIPGQFPIPGLGGNLANLTAGPDRYAFYGLVTGTRIMPIGQGLGFRTALEDDPERTYSITPFGDKGFEFGKTGPFLTVVSTTTETIMPGANSLQCGEPDDKPNAQIKRSDDLQLIFTVKTDLCVKDIITGASRRVDTLDGEFTLPFGRKYHRETAQSDLINPSLEIYIDEYLYDVAAMGIPIPPSVKLSDGSYPRRRNGGTGAPGGGGGSGGGTTHGEETCKCTCDEFQRIQKSLELAKKTKSQDPKVMADIFCLQKCMPQLTHCFRK